MSRRLFPHALLLLLFVAAAAAAPQSAPSSANEHPAGEDALSAAALTAIEERIGGRIGVALVGGDGTVRHDHRGGERFAMCSTFKLALSAAVLEEVAAGRMSLDDIVPFGEADLLDYAPVTREHVADGRMTVGELAEAISTVSDNTAANLLLARIGGPAALTEFFRRHGDELSRLDRTEPELNENAPGDARDTTTPRAMAGLVRRLVLGDALGDEAREQLAAWAVANRTGDNRIRAGIPDGWRVGDKTGTCGTAYNDVAIVWPPGAEPFVLAVYVDRPTAETEQVEAAIAEIGGLAAKLATARERPSRQDRNRAAAEAVNRPLVYHVDGEETVRVRKDLVYRSDPEAKADVYLPPDDEKGAEAPMVVLIHGGVPDVPVRPKDWGIFESWGRLLAASGLVTVVFNHRLGFPEPFMTEAADDVEHLLAYVREHAADLGGDPDRICLVAYSAGGPLLSRYIREPRPYVRCLAAFYSMLDIRGSEVHQEHMTQEELDLFSPAAQLEAHASTMAPLFVMRAGRDEVPGLNRWMETFLDIAIEKNAPITLMIHPTGVHGFENTTDDERSREILRAAIAFMKAHLGLPPAPQ